MDKLIPSKINVITHRNEFVLTTEQLALLYGTDVNNIRMNFSNNKDRFESGVHYYCLEGVALKAFKNNINDIGFVHKRINRLYLWTKRGASRHSKILDTDMSWNVFDRLEESYFGQKPTEKNVKMLDYLDKPVTIVKEIAKAYRCSGKVILDYLDCIPKGEDYDGLMGEDLRILKEDNALDKSICNSYVIYPSGLKKIKRYLEKRGYKLALENPKEVLLIQ